MSSPTRHWLMEKRLMCRRIRVPPVLDQVFHTRHPHVHWHHRASFRWLVVVLAVAWGRRHVASLSRSRKAQPHRTRFDHCFVVARWDPEAALRQQAQAGVMARHPGQGETCSRVLEGSNTATRGPHRDAGATRQDPVTEGSMQGPQDVGALVRCRAQVMPSGLRLDVTREDGPALALPCRQTTAWAAHRWLLGPEAVPATPQ